MKRKGILHYQLSSAVAKLGHGDILLIGDVGCAFPSNAEVTCIDLAVTEGVPSVDVVLRVVMEELEVEKYILAEEIMAASPSSYRKYKEIISAYKSHGNVISETILPHLDMKNIWLGRGTNGEQMKVFVRTGECTPYGYIMLVAGVDF